jgi:predicted nucleic acid-binding protein
MNVYFLDTSALVKRYHRERGSAVIDALFTAADRRLIISDLSILEFGSALAKKVRDRAITPEQYHRALGFFCQNIVTETMVVEIMGEEDKAMAATLLEKYSLQAPLRTLDSLQLAVMKRVAEHQLDQVVCADRPFCTLILQEGIAVRNPEEDRMR